MEALLAELIRARIATAELRAELKAKRLVFGFREAILEQPEMKMR